MSSKAQKSNSVSVPVSVPVTAPSAPVTAPVTAPQPAKPKATRAKAPADPDKPKVKPLEMKYKTLLAGMLWLLDESRLRDMFADMTETDDPNQLEQDELDQLIDAAPIFRRTLKILESDTVKREMLQTIDIKQVYKTHVGSVIAEHKKAETRRRNEEKKRIKQAELKAAKANGTHVPRAKRAPKATIPVPEPEPITAPVYNAPIDFGDEDSDRDSDRDSDSDFKDAPDDSADERLNLDFDAEVARSMVNPDSEDDVDTQMLSGTESVVRIPTPPPLPAKTGRGRATKSKLVDTKASDTDEPVDKPIKPAAKRGRKATMV